MRHIEAEPTPRRTIRGLDLDRVRPCDRRHRVQRLLASAPALPGQGAIARREHTSIGREVDREWERHRGNQAPQRLLSRDDLLRLLWAENVRARRYFYPGVHRMEPYASLYPDAAERLPHTTKVADRVLVFPTGLAIDETTVDRIGAILRVATDDPSELHTRLGALPPGPTAVTGP